MHARGAWLWLLPWVLSACGGGLGMPRWEPAGAPDQAGGGAYASADDGLGPRSYARHLETPAEARNSYAPFLSMLVPGISVRFAPGKTGADPWVDDDPVEQGFVWSVPFLVQAGGWRHGVTLSLAQYLGSFRQVERVVYRLRLLSIGGDEPILHAFVGAGGFHDHDLGFGPRIELGWLLGRLGQGSASLVVGWEYAPQGRDHVVETAVAAFVPYVIH